jgi:ribosomal protein S18 acetylase RimI-like enzyme
MIAENIAFVVVDQSKLDKVETLWNKLRLHHMNNSLHFKERYQTMNFRERIAPLLKKCKNGELFIEIASDKLTKKDIGYCISSFTNLTGKEGEIESLYIEPEYRGLNIGRTLVENALHWMDAKNVTIKRVVVAAGNESAIHFYAKFGFYTKSLSLEQG